MDTTSSPPTLLRSCTFHPDREAVVRCPECGRPFCRECVTEHDFRMICAGCLARWKEERRRGRAGRRGRFLVCPLMPMLQTVLAVVIAWLGFHVLGRVLLQIPTEFHEGTAPRDLLQRLGE